MKHPLYETTQKGLLEFYGQVIAGNAVYAPVDKFGKFKYKKIKSLSECNVDSPIKSTETIKGLFFPQASVVAKYQTSSAGLTELPIEADELKEKKVIIGVKPCDAQAIQVLEKVMTWDYKDEDFLARRASSTIISILCIPVDTCFCTSSDYDILTSDASDILVINAGETVYLKPQTEKGAALISANNKGLQQSSADAEEKIKARFEEFKKGFTINFNYTDINESLAKPESFESPHFDSVALSCMGCNACGFVCPTCHCFKIADEKAGDKVVRYKCYDSCNSKYFTLMAGGHNPRPAKYRRWRQRAMHKFVYYKERFGVNLCIGCGKCAMNCPVCIKISDVVTDVASKTAGGSK